LRRIHCGAERVIIMRIESSDLLLSSHSNQTTISESSEQLDVRIQTVGQNNQSNNNNVDTFEIKEVKDVTTCDLPDKDTLEMQLLSKMIKSLTGKELHFYIPVKQQLVSENNKMYFVAPKKDNVPSPGVNWSINYQKREYFEENANMSFSAAGRVKTTDGKTIDLNLRLNLSRSFSSTAVTTFTAGNAVDPLVINYNGSSAELTAQKYDFDLDNDGNQEKISFVKQGSGFLVLDKNLDGKINNGGEMFGPSTGNGFMELKSFDSDGNHWIDENDAIYDRLQIWTKDENGKDKLLAIGQVGIGAIYLGNVSSNYELKDTANTLHGTIRETGIFLRENTTAGTIQHIDLCV
jgi:hypothetical protein